MSSPVEDVAAAIAEQVREKGWHVDQHGAEIYLRLHATALAFCTLWCQDASQAARLAEMMQQAPKPARGVFAAMGIDPVDPLDRFPSIRGKA